MGTRRLATWLGLACLVAGCSEPDFGYAVRVDVDVNPSVSDATLADVRMLQVEISGAETGTRSLPLSRFSASRQERFVYRPTVAAGGLVTLAVVAQGGSGTALASGSAMVTLRPGKTVALTVRLDSGGLPPFGVTPASARVGRNGTLALTAGRAVHWSVTEPMGGSIDPGGAYTAPALPGIFHVVATAVDDIGQTVTVPITVAFNQVGVLVGAPGGAGDRDGVSAAARFDALPFNSGIVAAPDGTLYVADRTNNLIRTIAPDGTVATLIDPRGLTASGDRPALTFSAPCGLALDAAGRTLYVTEVSGQDIRRVDSTTTPPTVALLAGTPANGGIVDSSDPTQVRFNAPVGLAIDVARNRLYVTDNGNNRIRAVALDTGATTTLAGSGARSSVDSQPGPVSFDQPAGIAYDGTTLWVSDLGAVVRRVQVDPLAVTTIAGKAETPDDVDGAGVNARFALPSGLVVAGSRLVVTDRGNHNIRAIDKSSGLTVTLAGPIGQTPPAGYLDGSGPTARFNQPSSAAVFGADLFVLDVGNESVRKVAGVLGSAPAVSTVAGLPYEGAALDGVGTAARLDVAQAMVLAGDGTAYVSDWNNDTLRKLTLTASADGLQGALQLVAGSPRQPGGADGKGSAAGIGHIHSFAFDGQHTIYFADNLENAIRSFDTGSQEVTTLASAPGPRDVALDGAGTLYFTQDQHTISKMQLPSGKPAVVWGLAGTFGFVDGKGTNARLDQPTGLAWDPAGGLWVADTKNHAIRRIDVAGGALTTVANLAGHPGLTDGDAAAARFDLPFHLQLLANGQLIIVDEHNQLVRVFDPVSHQVGTLLGVPGIQGVQVGAAPGGLGDPRGLLVLPTGELLVGSGSEAVVQIAY